jgi:hypothetical protein
MPFSAYCYMLSWMWHIASLLFYGGLLMTIFTSYICTAYCVLEHHTVKVDSLDVTTLFPYWEVNPCCSVCSQSFC